MKATQPVILFALTAGAVARAAAEEPRIEREVVAAEIPSRETGWEGDHATGDWGGVRPILTDLGIHFSGAYAGEVLANVAGGVRRGAVYDGLLELALELNSSDMRLWEGGLFRVSSLYPHGPSLSQKYTGDIQTASNIDAYDSFRLYELWYQQNLFEGTLSLRLGQLAADEEFARTEAGSPFLNSSFGWPAFISGNVPNTGPAFFVATPGIRLRYEPVETFFVQAGVYDGDSFDSAIGDAGVNPNGTRIQLGGREGFFAISEAGFRWNDGEKARRMPGIFRAGAWLHTGDFESHLEDRQGGNRAASGLPARSFRRSYGFYGAVEQMVWREEGEQGLWVFGRAGFAPSDRSLFEYAVDAGLTYIGLLPGRDEDVMGLGMARARVSRDLGRFEREEARIQGGKSTGFSDQETVLEGFYSVRVNDWWTVQPDVQWIFHPGGSDALSDAVVVGLRTEIVF